MVTRALAHFEAQDWPQYDLVTNNCEHFAVWCKAGTKVSSQVLRRPPPPQ